MEAAPESVQSMLSLICLPNRIHWIQDECCHCTHLKSIYCIFMSLVMSNGRNPKVTCNVVYLSSTYITLQRKLIYLKGYFHFETLQIKSTHLTLFESSIYTLLIWSFILHPCKEKPTCHYIMFEENTSDIFICSLVNIDFSFCCRL